MRRASFLALPLLAAGALALWHAGQAPVHAQQAGAVPWIWFDEGDPARNAPAGTRYFRRTFTINRPVPRPVVDAHLDITADDGFTVWVNGAPVGKGDRWDRVYRFDVHKHLRHGKNVLAVEGVNRRGPAGLLVRLNYLPNGGSQFSLTSDD